MFALGLGLECTALPGALSAQDATAPASQPPAAQAGAQAAAEPEPEPVENAERPAPKANRQCSTQDVLSGVCSQEEAAQAAKQKMWRLMARAELELPVIWDESPETEMLAHYYLGGEIDLPFGLQGLYATAWLPFIQRFYRIEGQSPIDFEDPLFAIGYRHRVDVGNNHALGFVHRFGVRPPLARPSRHNLNYSTLDWLTAGRYALGAFTMGVDIWLQYAFYQYSSQFGDSISTDGELFGVSGGSNTMFRFEGGPVLQYTLFDLPSAGSMLAEASFGYRHRVHYDGSYDPAWYWSVGATYTPITYFSLGLSMDHGYSSILRGGVPELSIFDRDETRWRFAVYGRY